MTTRKWLTNAHQSEVQQVTARLCAGWIGRRIAQGEPQPTEAENADSLRVMGKVGIYHVGADDPVTVEVVWPGRGR